MSVLVLMEMIIIVILRAPFRDRLSHFVLCRWITFWHNALSIEILAELNSEIRSVSVYASNAGNDNYVVEIIYYCSRV